jgi:hypothetical protein
MFGFLDQLQQLLHQPVADLAHHAERFDGWQEVPRRNTPKHWVMPA